MLKDKCECIPINAIKVDSSHIRKKPGKVDNLKCTVSDVGLLQPILVRRSGEHFVVIDGERRLRAMRELAIPELIVGREVVIDVDETDADARFKQVIANVQREDVDHFDLGHAFVMLKEKYGYQYREIAEIIGKTPHYVTTKVGLVKRLIPEVQEMAVSDWEASKCIMDTFSEDEEPDIYEMNIKIIEDIARLPSELQKMAYLSIKSKAMDINEALKFLRSMKKRHLKSDMPGQEAPAPYLDLLKYLEKIDRDIDVLAGRLRMADQQNRQDLLNKLESSLEKLSLLYARLKGGMPAAEEADRSEALV
jgi:ParB family chromosome partitioning protein